MERMPRGEFEFRFLDLGHQRICDSVLQKREKNGKILHILEEDCLYLTNESSIDGHGVIVRGIIFRDCYVA